MKKTRKKEPPAKAGATGTAERLREAAEELFCRRSYEAVSVGDIAERAGVNKALVFYHFESKAQLFALVLEGYYESHRAALAGAFEGEGTMSERLHRMVDAYLDFMTENKRYATLIQLQMTEPSIRPLIRRHVEPLFRWIRSVVADVTPAKGPLSARQFYVTFSGIVTNYFTSAPLLEEAWGGDPMSPKALEERRQHVHWMVDAMLAHLALRTQVPP